MTERSAELVVGVTAGAVTFEVRVKPRSSRSQVLGVRDGMLDVALRAPPVDGAANAELCRLLARRLGVATGHVVITHGSTSRRKRVSVRDVREALVRSRLVSPEE